MLQASEIPEFAAHLRLGRERRALLPEDEDRLRRVAQLRSRRSCATDVAAHDDCLPWKNTGDPTSASVVVAIRVACASREKLAAAV